MTEAAGELSERALVLAPVGRDATLAARIVGEAGVAAHVCRGLDALVEELARGAGLALLTEEAIDRAQTEALDGWLMTQPEWSDFPFILLTQRGGGLERNPAAGRYLKLLGNVTFVERPFHPTTLVSLVESALRGRRRQYEARTRLERLHEIAEDLERRVEQRTRERETALAQLHEVQKLESIGQLTGGIAHDFNNLLTPVMANLDLLRRRVAGDARAERFIDSALQASSRAATLVQRLLAFARRQDLQPRAVDVGALLLGLEDLIARSLGPQIAIEIDVARGLPAALIDPNQLDLAVLNLAINARDAMPGGGTLRLALSCSGDGFLRLEVADTGSGMDAATLKRAVEPFYSTKGPGKGTGLGLSMVHGLVVQSGGRLDIASTPGRGTTVTLSLPRSATAAPVPPPLAAAAAATRGSAHILLVDDEALIREGLAEMLGELGYAVETAASAAEALRLFGERRFDLMVTDYLMPQMNGAQLAAEVRKQRPDLPVLLITGYSSIDQGLGSDLARLAKPFRHHELASRVAEMVGERRVAATA